MTVGKGGGLSFCQALRQNNIAFSKKETREEYGEVDIAMKAMSFVCDRCGHWCGRRRRRVRAATLHDTARRCRAYGAGKRKGQVDAGVHAPAEVLVERRGGEEHIGHARDLVDAPVAERLVSAAVSRQHGLGWF